MTSSRLFFNMLREHIKRQMWCVVLALLTAFFYFPVLTAIEGRIRSDSASSSDILYATRNVLNCYTATQPFLIILTVGAALLLGVSLFRYLHSPRMVDCYHALPVRREMMFATRYLSGVVIYAGTYLCGLIATVMVSFVLGLNVSTMWVNLFYSFFVMLLTFLLVYTIVVIAMELTGKTIIGILGAVVLCSYTILVHLLYSGLCALFFSNYSGYSAENVLEQTKWTSVVSRIVLNYTALAEVPKDSLFYDIITDKPVFYSNCRLFHWIPANTMLAMIVTLAVLVMAAVFLMKIRKSESAGKSMAFEISRPIVKILILPPAAVGISVFFYLIGSGELGWLIFGAICGAIMIGCGLEVIFDSDIKAILRKKAQTGIGIVITLAIGMIFYFDLFGYSSYIPKQSDIQGVYLDFGFDSWATRGYRENFTVNGREQYYTDVDTIYPLLYYLAKQDQKENNGKYAIVEEYPASEYYDHNKDTDYFVGPATVYYTRSGTVSVGYHKTNGDIVYRQYVIYYDDPEVMELIDHVYVSKEYKEMRFDLYDSRWMDGVTELDVTTGDIQYSVLDKRKINEFLQIYREEFLQCSLTEAVEGKTLYYVTYNASELPSREDSYYSFAMVDYPVFEHFTRSVAWLKENMPSQENERYERKLVSAEMGIEDAYFGNYYRVYDAGAVEDLMQYFSLRNVYLDYMGWRYYAYVDLQYEYYDNGEIVDRSCISHSGYLKLYDLSKYEQYLEY